MFFYIRNLTVVENVLEIQKNEKEIEINYLKNDGAIELPDYFSIPNYNYNDKLRLHCDIFHYELMIKIMESCKEKMKKKYFDIV